MLAELQRQSCVQNFDKSMRESLHFADFCLPLTPLVGLRLMYYPQNLRSRLSSFLSSSDKHGKGHPQRKRETPRRKNESNDQKIAMLEADPFVRSYSPRMVICRCQPSRPIHLPHDYNMQNWYKHKERCKMRSAEQRGFRVCCLALFFITTTDVSCLRRTWINSLARHPVAPRCPARRRSRWTL